MNKPVKIGKGAGYKFVFSIDHIAATRIAVSSNKIAKPHVLVRAQAY